MNVESNAIEVLQKLVSEGLGGLIARRNQFFQKTFLSSIQVALCQVNSSQEEQTLGQAYMLLGKLHDILNAPLCALRAYKLSTTFFQSRKMQSFSYLEQARIYSSLGSHQTATRLYELAKELNPGNLEIEAWLDYEKSCLNDPSHFLSKDFDWHGSEAMASGYPEKALACFDKLPLCIALQRKASIHAAMGRTDKVIQCWVKLLKLDLPAFQFRYADFFYLSDALFFDPNFWKILKKVAGRNKSEIDAYLLGVFSKFAGGEKLEDSELAASLPNFAGEKWDLASSANLQLGRIS